MFVTVFAQAFRRRMSVSSREKSSKLFGGVMKIDNDHSKVISIVQGKRSETNECGVLGR